MTFQTVSQAVNWIMNSKMDANRSGLQKIKYALKLLNNPQSQLPIIHLTGTNGKGSTTAFLSRLLNSQGYRVASFTSPHIEKINERVQYDGKFISDENLLTYANRIFEINELLISEDFGSLGFFEIMTIIAALYFNDVQPDVCLIEVGIGGLKDNTNVFDGDIAVITTIGFDHEDKLGHSLEDIAYQKAGIIKENATVITGNITDKNALRIIENTAANNNAKVYRYHQEFNASKISITSSKQTQFVFENASLQFNALINLIGHYQVDNASIAIEVCLLWMKRTQRSLNLNALQNALATTNWPARLEKIYSSPLIYIDGAHNVLGLESLKQALTDYFSEYNVRLMYSGLSKKDQKAHLSLLATFPVSEVVLTEFKFEGDVLSVNHAYKLLQEYELSSHISFSETKNWQHYIQQFIRQGQKNDLLLVTGSLYFVSQVREILKK